MRITNNIILHNTTGNINGNKVNVNNLNNQMIFRMQNPG